MATKTTYTINGNAVDAADLPAYFSANNPGQGVSFGNGFNPYFGADMAALDAQQALYNAQFGQMPLEMAELGALRDLEKGRVGLIPLNLATIAANRDVIEAQLGLIPGQLSEVELQKAYAQAQFDAGQLELPVLRDQREQSLLAATQALESAESQNRLSLSANQAERLGIQDQVRQTNRGLTFLPPDIAAEYRGSNYVNPASRYAREDAAAKLGILSQRNASVDLSDSDANLRTRQTKDSSALATRAANNQFAAREAMFNTRDEQLAAQMQGFENSKNRINVGIQEAAAAKAGLTAREAAELLGYKESDARMAALNTREGQIQLGNQQFALQNANLNAERMRLTNPINNQSTIPANGQVTYPTYAPGYEPRTGYNSGFAYQPPQGSGPLGMAQFGGYQGYGQGPLGMNAFDYSNYFNSSVF